MIQVQEKMQGARMHDLEDISRFLLGGRAVFTVRSCKTGNRYTFRVKKPRDGEVFFVSLLVSPDEYAYLGMIDREGNFRLTRKSKMTDDSIPVRTFRWIFKKAMDESLKVFPPEAEFWHEGRCCKCGHSLTVPESIAAGIGPICAGKGV